MTMISKIRSMQIARAVATALVTATAAHAQAQTAGDSSALKGKLQESGEVGGRLPNYHLEEEFKYKVDPTLALGTANGILVI